MTKRKILLFVKIPPPLTGATLINNYVSNSKLLKEKYFVKGIWVTYKKQISDKYKYTIIKSIKIIKIYFRLLMQLVTFNPKIVYFQVSPIGIAFLRDCTYIFWLKIFRKHIVYHLHGMGIKEASKRFVIMRSFYRWAFNGSSVICLSNLLVEDISSVYSGVPYIVNNGIPKITDSFDKNYDNKTTVNILFLSNLLYSKGILVFLDALSLLDVLSPKKIRVQVVGKEAELSANMINDEINKRGLYDFVAYVGPKYGEDKTVIYQSTDILIYPTLNDAFPVVLLEAMQFGIPVIASKEGAIPEIVNNGHTGFVVDKNSPEQIAEKLEILINDSDLRKKMGQAGQVKFLEKYTLEIFEKNMVKVFDDVIKNLCVNK